MSRTSSDKSLPEIVIEQTKATGVLPCIKLHRQEDWLAYASAMYEGGARVIEVTMTTPGALEAIRTISGEFGRRLLVAAGTVLDIAMVHEVVSHGGSLLVSPTVRPEVIRAAKSLNVPVYSGAFTATECQLAMEAGASMVKVFPARLGGPQYMTNLRMVFPEINLIPSGGITPENAAEYIRCGACAVSGARTFMNMEKIGKEGLRWITEQVARFIKIIREAKKNLPPLP